MRKPRPGQAFTLAVMLVLMALMAGRGARAQEVWRCGPEGRSYSDQPCAQGRALDLADPRSPEQVAQARRLALHELRTAQRWQREREAREAALLAANAAPVIIGTSKSGPAKAAPTKAPNSKKPLLPWQRAGDRTWPAIAHASPRKPG